MSRVAHQPRPTMPQYASSNGQLSWSCSFEISLLPFDDVAAAADAGVVGGAAVAVAAGAAADGAAVVDAVAAFVCVSAGLAKPRRWA